MVQQALSDVRLSDLHLSFRFFVEFPNGRDDFLRRERNFDNRILPVKNFVKFLIVKWAHANHDCARCGGFKIPVPEFALSARFLWLAKLARADDEIPAP